MDKQQLIQIQSIRKYPSVSILLGLFTSPTENQRNILNLKNLIKQAEERLLKEFSKREVEKIIDRLHSIAERIQSRLHYQAGLAIFVNDEQEFIIDLPFSVKQRVIIDHTFATRDLILGMNRSIRYYVMTLSAKEVHLYTAYRNILNEVQENGFPFHLSLEVIDVQRQFTIDKEVQVKEFYNNLDKAFNQLYNQQPLGLILVGAAKNISYYKEVANNPRAIVATIDGNYEHASIHELGNIVWNQVKELLSQQRNEVLVELEAAIKAQKYVSGIEQVWRLAKEGRGRLLLAEEDYSASAKIIHDNGSEFLEIVDDPTLPGVIDDLVDEVAEMVMLAGGQVVFVDNGKLKEHQGVALILRY
ncbi:MAG: hypothetical protein RML72_09795 [Bacteroidia bacterium]|nr:hypothetical protein [Bacteroidia bacterium]MDW8159148.1 hypothetical protein [Bacteroidia bacterium]